MVKSVFSRRYLSYADREKSQIRTDIKLKTTFKHSNESGSSKVKTIECFLSHEISNSFKICRCFGQLWNVSVFAAICQYMNFVWNPWITQDFSLLWFQVDIYIHGGSKVTIETKVFYYLIILGLVRSPANPRRLHTNTPNSYHQLINLIQKKEWKDR